VTLLTDRDEAPDRLDVYEVEVVVPVVELAAELTVRVVREFTPSDRTN